MFLNQWFYAKSIEKIDFQLNKETLTELSHMTSLFIVSEDEQVSYKATFRFLLHALVAQQQKGY